MPIRGPLHASYRADSESRDSARTITARLTAEGGTPVVRAEACESNTACGGPTILWGQVKALLFKGAQVGLRSVGEELSDGTTSTTGETVGPTDRCYGPWL